MRNLTQGEPWKVIIRFMIPVLLGNLLQLTYSIADTRIVGYFLGDEALAGVGATAVLHSLIMGFFMGIANGFAIMLAQFYGAQKNDRVKVAFAASLFMGAVLSILLITGTLLALYPLLGFLNVPTSLMPIASGYIRIILGGMIITMFYDILLASARAIGDSITPLLILVVSVVLNIIGDIVFLGIFHTDVRGAAVATVGAQMIALIICAVYLLKKYPFFRLKGNDFKKIELPMVKSMLATGMSMGFMSSLVNLGSLILQTAINTLGYSYIVAQTAARKWTEVLMSILIAMGQTLATYSGQNYGAGDFDRIKRGMKVAHIVNGCWCIIVLIIVYLFSPYLIHMVTGSQDTVMIEAAVMYLKVDSILYAIVGVIIVLRNTLQGMGERMIPILSSGIEMVGKMILTVTLVPRLGYTGVILVEPIVWVFMVIPLLIKMKSVIGGR